MLILCAFYLNYLTEPLRQEDKVRRINPVPERKLSHQSRCDDDVVNDVNQTMPEEQRQIKLLTALGNLLTLGPDRQCAVDVTKAAAGQCRTQDERAGRRRHSQEARH